MPVRTMMTLSRAVHIACTSSDPSFIARALWAGLKNTMIVVWNHLPTVVQWTLWLIQQIFHPVLIVVRKVTTIIGHVIRSSLSGLKHGVSHALNGIAGLFSTVLRAIGNLFTALAGLGWPGILFVGTTIASVVLYILYPQQVIDFAILVLGYLKKGFELGKEGAKEAWQSDMGQKVAHFVYAALDVLPGAFRKARGVAQGLWNMLAHLVKEIKEVLGNQPLGTYRRFHVD